jgi:hypothetical protein
MTDLDRPNLTLNPTDYLVQFVCFETILRASLFHPIWKPFANRFMNKGIEVLLLNEAKESPTQSVPFRFISQNWWPKKRFEEAFPNGQLVGNVNIGLVQVAQAGGFVFSDYMLPEGTNPRASFDGNKLFVLGHGSPLSSAEVKAAHQASQAEATLFFTRSAANRESLFDWLLELRGDQPITAQRREELQAVLLAGGVQRRLAFQSFQQSLRLSEP